MIFPKRPIFFVLIALSILNSSCGVQNFQLSPSWSPTHFAERHSPYSKLDGRTITVLPAGISFDIPESWTKQIYKKSLFLSWDDLNEVNKPKTYNFERVETSVMDAVAPFESCAVHAGEKGWNSGVLSDQLRFYISDEKAETILERIENKGLTIAKINSNKATISKKPIGRWANITIRFVDAPTHAILIRDIAFYVSSHNDRTFIIVFLHPGGEQLILSTLNSFRVPK